MTAPLIQTAKPRKDVTRPETYIVTRWRKIIQTKGTTVIGPALELTVHQPRNPKMSTTIAIGTKPNVEWFMSMPEMLALAEGVEEDVNWTITANCMPSPFGGHSYKILTASEVKIFKPWSTPYSLLPAPRPPLLLASQSVMPVEAPTIKEPAPVEPPAAPSGIHWYPSRFADLPVEVQRRFTVASERLHDQMLAFLLGEKPNYDKESQAVSDFDHAIRALGRDYLGFEKRKMEVKPERGAFAPIQAVPKAPVLLNPNAEQAAILKRLIQSIMGQTVETVLGAIVDVDPFRVTLVKDFNTKRDGIIVERRFPSGWLAVKPLRETFYEGDAARFAPWQAYTDKEYAAAVERMKKGTTHALDSKDRARKHTFDKKKALR